MKSTNYSPTASATQDAALARRTSWERASRWPMIVLSFAYLVGYTVIAAVPERPDAEFLLIVTLIAVAWLAFIVDVIVRLALTPRHERRAYFRAHRIVMFSALLPVLRPFTMLQYLHTTPGFSGEEAGAVRSRIIASAASYAALFVYVMAVLVLQAERDAPGATIDSLGNALWWACVTLATVGYGDFVPVTVLGRIFAVMLMAGGVVIIGTASALIVSYLTERNAAYRRRVSSQQHGRIDAEQSGTESHNPGEPNPS